MRYLGVLLILALVVSACTKVEAPSGPTAVENSGEEVVDEAPAQAPASPTGDWRDGLPEVLARVGEVTIDRDAFLAELALARAAVEVRAAEAGEPVPETFQLDEEAGLRLAQSLVDNELLGQYARKLGHDVSAEELEEALDRGKGAFPTETAYRESLARQGLTEEGVRARVARRLLVGKLIDTRTKDLRADEAQVKAEYQQLLGLGAFDMPESATLNQIFVPLPEGEEKESIETVLQAAFAKLGEGIPFAEAAGEATVALPDAHVAENLLLVRGRVDAVLEEKAFAGAIGEPIAPFRSPSGWHLVVVTERRPPRSLSLEEVRPRIEERVLFSEQQAAFVALVEEALKEIPVEFNWQFPEHENAGDGSR